MKRDIYLAIAAVIAGVFLGCSAAGCVVGCEDWGRHRRPHFREPAPELPNAEHGKAVTP